MAYSLPSAGSASVVANSGVVVVSTGGVSTGGVSTGRAVYVYIICAHSYNMCIDVYI